MPLKVKIIHAYIYFITSCNMTLNLDVVFLLSVSIDKNENVVCFN